MSVPPLRFSAPTRALSPAVLLSLLWALACAGAQGGEPLGVPPSAPDAGCAACHGEQAAAALAARGHRDPLGGYGCLTCHTAHRPAPGGAMGPSELRAACGECHLEIEAEFRLPFRHRLGSAVTCTDCHPPHGLPARELRRHLRHGACVACHVEMRGPFLFEHDGDRNLGCLSCHEPHGSVNRRLLTHAEARMLCLSCHVNLEDIHVQEPDVGFRDCLNCHTEVHGSNWDRELFR